MAAQFKEISRMTVSDAKDIVMSAVREGGQLKGVHINYFVRTERYTGFTKDGVFIPKDNLKSFANLIKSIDSIT